MISVVEAISDLLYVRDTVVVPGLGAFMKKTIPAEVNPVANYFTMPSSEIVFDGYLREDNDLIVSYIAEKNEISEEEARQQLALFVNDCFSNMKHGKKVVLNNIGTLYYDWAGDLAFQQDKTVNYNADVFGLCDFTSEPVLRSKTKEEIRAEIEQQQKDKNTPITVDEKAVHEHDNEGDKDNKDDDFEDEDDRRWTWLWILLGILFLVGVGYGLHHFKVVDFSKWFGKNRPAECEPWTIVLPEAKTWETEKEEPQEQAVDTLEEQQQPEQQPAPEVVNTDANIRIIAGCFPKEENAARFANTLRSNGYSGAFYELRGNKWYVSFGRYATEEEATAALREIRKNTEYKAWILSQ